MVMSPHSVTFQCFQDKDKAQAESNRVAGENDTKKVRVV